MAPLTVGWCACGRPTCVHWLRRPARRGAPAARARPHRHCRANRSNPAACRSPLARAVARNCRSAAACLRFKRKHTVVSPVDEPIVRSVWRELHVRRCAVHKCKCKHSHSTEDPHERARAGNACSGCVVVVVRVSDCLRWGVSSQRNVWRM